MLNLLAVIIPIALLDSLNPVTIAVHVYLLGTPQPRNRTLSFMIGIFIAYFAGGLLLALGLNSILEYLNNFSETFWRGVQAIIAVLLIGFGWYLQRGNKQSTDEPAHSTAMSASGSFWLGFVVTATDLPTAVPYIAAIERILQARLSIVPIIGLIAFYNLIYLLPLIALFGIRFLLGERGVETLEKVNGFVSRWSSPVLAVVCIVAGVALLIDCLLFVLGIT